MPASLLLVLTADLGLAKSENSCQAEDFAAAYVRAYEEGKPLANPEEVAADIETISLAHCHQLEVVGLLRESLGSPIGYKVAFTSKTARQQSGIASPLVGILLEEMILPDGATIATNSGSKLVYELDLLVEVGSDRINEAKTIEDVARHLKSVRPFIEVPDLMLPPGSQLTAPLLVAMNAGARWGVAGKPVPVEANEEFLAAIGDLKVKMYDGSGVLLTEANGKDILGHPFNSVLFLLETLRERGEYMFAGDVISLGSFGRFHFAQPGKKAIALYRGLPGGTMTVLVKFE